MGYTQCMEARLLIQLWWLICNCIVLLAHWQKYPVSSPYWGFIFKGTVEVQIRTCQDFHPAVNKSLLKLICQPSKYFFGQLAVLLHSKQVGQVLLISIEFLLPMQCNAKQSNPNLSNAKASPILPSFWFLNLSFFPLKKIDSNIFSLLCKNRFFFFTCCVEKKIVIEPFWRFPFIWSGFSAAAKLPILIRVKTCLMALRWCNRWAHE